MALLEYTPAQAATLVGVHGNSIRAWCREYAEVLSSGASARPRKLTPGDVATLQHVAAYRAAGLSPTDILQRLRELPPDATAAPTVNVTAETVATALASSPDALTAAIATLAASIAVDRNAAPGVTVEDFHQAQESTRAELARLRLALVAVGVAVGVLLLTLIVVLLVR